MTIAMGTLWILSGVICSLPPTTPSYISLYMYICIYVLRFSEYNLTPKYHLIIHVRKEKVHVPYQMYTNTCGHDMYSFMTAVN